MNPFGTLSITAPEPLAALISPARSRLPLSTVKSMVLSATTLPVLIVRLSLSTSVSIWPGPMTLAARSTTAVVSVALSRERTFSRAPDT